MYFLIYINDIPDNLESNVKLFEVDTWFLVVRDSINTLKKLNNALDKVSLWANKWKMSFDADLSKHAQEVIFNEIWTKYITHIFYVVILPFKKYYLKNI